MAEALVNHYLGGLEIKAYSSGVAPSGQVNLNALKALEQEGIATNGLRSKSLAALEHINFDLVVTVCDHAKETCPMFPGRVPVLHVGFADPSGGPEEGYAKTLRDIRDSLLPEIKTALEI